MSERKPVGKPFEKGRSGNPGGRPKGVERAFREQIAEAECIDVEVTVGPDGKETRIEHKRTGWEMAKLRLLRIMQFGEDKDAIQAIKLMYERAYGKPKEQVDMTVADVTEEHRRMLDALRMTPHERRRALEAQDTTEAPDPAPLEADDLGDL